ncbi:uncharacterized protein [Amphiura filiformis]|uniref:uncharacterized protein n=1 Tax=Amphiura filiformis TaxID=82378 RepID=UPI003B21EA7F
MMSRSAPATVTTSEGGSSLRSDAQVMSRSAPAMVMTSEGESPLRSDAPEMPPAKRQRINLCKAKSESQDSETNESNSPATFVPKSKVKVSSEPVLTIGENKIEVPDTAKTDVQDAISAPEKKVFDTDIIVMGVTETRTSDKDVETVTISDSDDDVMEIPIEHTCGHRNVEHTHQQKHSSISIQRNDAQPHHGGHHHHHHRDGSNHHHHGDSRNLHHQHHHHHHHHHHDGQLSQPAASHSSIGHVALNTNRPANSVETRPPVFQPDNRIANIGHHLDTVTSTESAPVQQVIHHGVQQFVNLGANAHHINLPRLTADDGSIEPRTLQQFDRHTANIGHNITNVTANENDVFEPQTVQQFDRHTANIGHNIANVTANESDVFEPRNVQQLDHHTANIGHNLANVTTNENDVFEQRTVDQLPSVNDDIHYTLQDASIQNNEDGLNTVLPAEIQRDERTESHLVVHTCRQEQLDVDILRNLDHNQPQSQETVCDPQRTPQPQETVSDPQRTLQLQETVSDPQGTPVQETSVSSSTCVNIEDVTSADALIEDARRRRCSVILENLDIFFCKYCFEWYNRRHEWKRHRFFRCPVSKKPRHSKDSTPSPKKMKFSEMHPPPPQSRTSSDGEKKKMKKMKMKDFVLQEAGDTREQASVSGVKKEYKKKEKT